MDISTLEKQLSDLGVAREDAAARRQAIFSDLRQLSIKAEAGDKKALYAQGPLNKDVEDLSRLIIKIDREINDKKRMLDLCRGQAAAIASRAAAAQSSTAEHVRWFEVNCPGGRVVRHRHASLESIRAALEPGYSVRSELFGTSENGEGGFSIATGQRQELLKRLQELSI
jgi:uncharacterized protein involved in exopolysaccharide biosynthesis